MAIFFLKVIGDTLVPCFSLFLKVICDSLELCFCLLCKVMNGCLVLRSSLFFKVTCDSLVLCFSIFYQSNGVTLRHCAYHCSSDALESGFSFIFTMMDDDLVLSSICSVK